MVRFYLILNQQTMKKSAIVVVIIILLLYGNSLWWWWSISLQEENPPFGRRLTLTRTKYGPREHVHWYCGHRWDTCGSTRLAHHIHNPNSEVVASPCRYQYHHLPFGLLFHTALLEGCLDCLHHLPPVRWGLWIRLHICPCPYPSCRLRFPVFCHPPPEFIRPHPQWASGVVRMKPIGVPLHLLIVRHSVVDQEGCHYLHNVIPRVGTCCYRSTRSTMI